MQSLTKFGQRASWTAVRKITLPEILQKEDLNDD